MRLVGGGLLPRVIENMLDAKVELDGRLRTVINDFTNSFTSKMTTSLASPAKSTNRGESYSNALRLTCKAIEKEVPNLRRILDEYLDDTRTKETLVGAVQDSVIQAYEDFFDSYTSTLEGGTRRGNNNKFSPVEKSRKAQEDGVWDVDTFAGWSEAVFRVGVAGLESSEGEAAAPSEEEDGGVKRGSDDGSSSGERRSPSMNGSL